jgi:hypothetical protein
VPRSAHAYSRAGYNLILLFPIIGLGVIDQDVPAPALLKFPQLYAVGQVGNGKPRPRSGVDRSVGMLCRRTAAQSASRRDGVGTGPASHRYGPAGECS